MSQFYGLLSMEETSIPINLSVVNDTLYHIWFVSLHTVGVESRGSDIKHNSERNWVNESVIVV